MLPVRTAQGVQPVRQELKVSKALKVLKDQQETMDSTELRELPVRQAPPGQQVMRDRREQQVPTEL